MQEDYLSMTAHDRSLEFVKMARAFVTVGQLMKKAKDEYEQTKNKGALNEYKKREAQFYALVETEGKRLDDIINTP